MLERLVAGVRAGQSHVLVLRGEAGVGKTALLGHLSAAAEGCRIAHAASVESEMELAFAGLHALCAQMLGRIGQLPSPQRDALNKANSPDAFGSGNSPAPFSRMHSADFTALSRLVAFLLPPLLPVPVPAGAFEQPAPIRATIARAASGRRFYSYLLPACGDCVDASSMPIVLGHCCILGSCVGSAYKGGQP